MSAVPFQFSTVETSMTDINKIAYVFPGQGSQKVGMGLDLYNSFDSVKAIFQEADSTLGFSLSKLIFEGPEEELRQTVNAQPALVVMSLACYQSALAVNDRPKIEKPLFLAGHSLGEYTALAIAGVLDYQTTVYMARERGRLMYEAGQLTAGSMAAILGLDEQAVTAICQETGTSLANINCPGQLVISGPKENIEKAIVLARSRGAARALPLQVSGAFHSPLMQPASDGLSAIINKLSFHDPEIPVLANTSAQPLNTAAEIKNELMQQLCHSVQWQRSVEYMVEKGVSTFIEIGSGNVLTGLIKRINKNVKTMNIGTVAELNNLVSQ
jgi:[acyl-carrier-protein] S-malonyltransferase